MSKALVDDWSLNETDDVLRLERSTLPDRLLARRRLVTALGAGMTAVALTLGGLQAPVGIGLIVWPLVGLFLLVAGLGLWAWQQARAALGTPLFLELQSPARRLIGVTAPPFAALSVSFDDIASVEVAREPGLTVPSAVLRVVTKSGQRFAGPALILASEVDRRLLPTMNELAHTLGRRLGCPVKTLD